MAPVYIVDIAAYKPPEEYKVNTEVLTAELNGDRYKGWESVTEENVTFLKKVHEKSGLSTEGTYLPPSIHPLHASVPRCDITAGREEAAMTMFGAVDALLKKTGTDPKDIHILVTCCSIFCPTPSSASMLVNKFGFPADVQSYHLGGMGCGTGVVGVSLIRDLLQAHPNCNAMFVPSEITSYCYYPGYEKNRLVSNVIFRMGGAAVLFTNRPAAKKTAKYELLHAERVHTGASDEAYGCMSWGPDSQGINGVYLAKTVVQQAGIALRQCLERITPRMLTWRQLADASAAHAKRWWYGKKDEETYTPDFTKCVEHFAVHAGGYAVLKGVQQGMKLPNSTMLPSFASLRDYGNTSCSTTWYVFSYIETCEGVKKGDRIMQIGMGGGMKVGINIWRALRDINDVHPAWEHLVGKPLTEADLPRNIEAVSDKTTVPRRLTQPLMAQLVGVQPTAVAGLPDSMSLQHPGGTPEYGGNVPSDTPPHTATAAAEEEDNYEAV